MPKAPGAANKVNQQLYELIKHDIVSGRFTQKEIKAKYKIGDTYFRAIKNTDNVVNMYKWVANYYKPYNNARYARRKAEQKAKEAATKPETVNGKSIPVGVVPRWDPYSEARAKAAKAAVGNVSRDSIIVNRGIRPTTPDKKINVEEYKLRPRNMANYYRTQESIAQALDYLVERTKKRTIWDRLFGR